MYACRARWIVRFWIARVRSDVPMIALLTMVTLSGGVLAQSPFTEEAIQRGIDYSVGPLQGGYGVALADLNNNGHADLLASGDTSGKIGLWRNDGTGHFIDVAGSSGFPLLGGAAAFAVGDYNGDGMLDVFIARRGWISSFLFRNKGDLQFEDVTDEAGIESDYWAEHAAFGDYNGDGWVDLYVSNMCTSTNLCATGHNHLFENQGDGTFTEIGAQLGVNDNGMGWHSIFYDFNRNGYPDIYVSNDRGHQLLQLNNRLYRNLGGEYEDISEASGADYAAFSMGVGVGDFSHTGHDDIYCTNIGLAGYLINTGDYTFQNSPTAGVPNNGFGWAAPMFDFDNDGMLDLYVCNAHDSPGGNRLYQNVGSLPPIEVSDAYGVSVNAGSTTVALADLTSDGSLDFVLSATSERLRLFINNEGAKNNWIKFQIGGVHPNLFAVGAMVDIRVGEQWQHRQLNGGNDFKGANHAILHFGLGDAEVVDEAIIRWAADAPAKVVFTDLPGNQTVVVDHPGIAEPVLGDLNDDGVVNVFDLLVLLGEWGDCDDCEACPADLDSSCAVNVFDLLVLLANWG